MRVVHDDVDLRLRVERREHLAERVVGLTLRAEDGGPLPAWAPGAHTDLTVGEGLVRQYSLCGDPADTDRWKVAVLREEAGTGGSARVHDVLREGDVLDARGPRNNFELVPSGRYVFLAGGIGITPILPMIAAADRVGADWRLHYGARTRARMAFADELNGAYGERVVLHVDDEGTGLDLGALLAAPQAGTLVYCCGPEGMLAVVEGLCARWPSGSLHVERFAPKPQAPPRREEAFAVELAQTGLTLSVPPDKTVMEVLEEAGVPILHSCREGTCGTCETVVLDGEVDHRDSLLTPEERAANDVMFVCVSRAAGPRLVLDI
jgi:ferredoxin-NADP reductase